MFSALICHVWASPKLVEGTFPHWLQSVGPVGSHHGHCVTSAPPVPLWLLSMGPVRTVLRLSSFRFH